MSRWRMAGPVVAAVWGVVAGLWTPRGPATTTEALASVAISLAVGFLAGWVTRSRWAMLLAPALFVVAFELLRIGYRGPTVDHPRLSALGILALLVGRVVHGLLTVLPLLVGAAYGAGLARRPAGGGRFRRYLGRAVIGLLAVVVAAVAVGIAIPARTAAVPDGVADLTIVHVGDKDLGLLIRGADTAAPVMLFVPGPPGGSEIGAMRKHLAALEQSFVVATLDRRGGGKSFGALDPASTFTLDDEVANVVAVADHLRARFGQDKVYLVAHSGGTIPATLAVQRQPELFTAYVGVGQVASPAESDRSQYDDTLAWARARGDDALAGRLTDVGPPPYGDLYSYEPMLTVEGAVYGSGNDAALTENFEVPEHSLLDKVHVGSGFLDSYDVYYPRVQDVDFRVQVPRLDVPVYLVAGAQEVPGRARNLQQWYAGLQAPHKEIVTLDDAGHRSLFQQPAEFTLVMRRVLAETR